MVSESQSNRNKKSVQDGRASVLDLLSGRRPLPKFEYFGDKFFRMEEWKNKITNSAVWNIYNMEYSSNQLFYMFSKYPQISKDMGIVISHNMLQKKMNELGSKIMELEPKLTQIKKPTEIYH